MAIKRDKKPAKHILTAGGTQDLSPNIIGAIADEVARTLVSRLPNMIPRPRRRVSNKINKSKKIDYGIFLDTSAVIDGRIFDVIKLGLLTGNIVITPSILSELKHLADSQDTVKRERGRKGLSALERLKKEKTLKVMVLSDDEEKQFEKQVEVDDRLIKIAKAYKGKVITCDYNLEKKSTIENVTTINMNALAHALKVIAVPGEALHIKVSHVGKEENQGVGYLADGTMIVVEEGGRDVGRILDVVVSRVISTAAGRILFAKKI